MLLDETLLSPSGMIEQDQAEARALNSQTWRGARAACNPRASMSSKSHSQQRGRIDQWQTRYVAN